MRLSEEEQKELEMLAFRVVADTPMDQNDLKRYNDLKTKRASVESGLTYQGPITEEARIPQCPEHPDHPWNLGFGYDGGGFGHYRICQGCGRVFAKVDISE